jgi:hypothetical protein
MNENSIYNEKYEALESVARKVLTAYDDTNPASLGLAIEHLRAQLDAFVKPITRVYSADLRQHPGELLEQLTQKQLSDLKRDWYKRASDEHIIFNCHTIGRQLGERVDAKYGNKYRWVNGDIKIYVDDYGQYMTVGFKGKCVCSTHPTSYLFVPGEWVKVIDQYAQAAIDRKRAKELELAEQRRRSLLKGLGA